jgi:hypothetical protein
VSAETAGASVPLHLTGTGARLVLALFIATQVLLTLVNLDEVASPWASILALILVSAAAGILTMRVPDPYPMPLVLVIAGVVVTATALVTWNMPASGVIGYAGWHWGAITFVLFVLALRRRIGWAWLCYAAMAALTLVWAQEVGRGVTGGLGLVDRHAGLLLVATLFAVGLRRTGRRIAAITRAQLELAQREAASRAVLAEQGAQTTTLDELARPALERIAGPDALTAAESVEFVLLEALLRDRLRAAALLTPAVTEAVRGARSAGVEVVLLDDRGESPLSPERQARVESAVLAALSEPGIEALTVRLLPAGRADLVTIVARRGAASIRTSVESGGP